MVSPEIQNKDLKIAVLGAGAIGSLAAGYLAAKGFNVNLIGRPDSVEAILKNKLKISGARGNFEVAVKASERLDFSPRLVILTVKTQDIAEALKDNLNFLKDSIVLTTQNGVRCDDITAGYLPKENIVSSIVMFGATYLKPAQVAHNFEGNWVLGSIFPESKNKLALPAEVLNTVFKVTMADDLKAMKYLKIFVNANNCIPAILGLSMQEAFSDASTCAISIGIWKEGLKIVSEAGIKLLSLPDFALDNLIKLTSLPTVQAAGIFSGIMLGLSKEPVYGSILQSIKRNRPSEIDYINGEFLKLAGEKNLSAPLNKKVLEMVHDVEKTGKFFSRQELLSAVKGLYN